MDDNTSDHLMAYRKFFETFKLNVNLNDPMPVTTNYQNVEGYELTGVVFDWCHRYLKARDCPPELLVPLCRTVLKEVTTVCHTQPNAFGYHDKCYSALELSRGVISCLISICARYEDNALLSSLPIPQENVYSTAVFAGDRNGRSHMEDFHAAIHDLHGLFDIKNGGGDVRFYAIYDGHNGTKAGQYCVTHMHQNLVSSVHYPNDPNAAFVDAFLTTDENFLSKNLKGGCTAVCLLLNKTQERAWLSWVGDSMAVLSRGGIAKQLVKPHKPNMPAERQRIEEAGGTVMKFSGVWRVGGVLALSRVIGDQLYKNVVTAQPDVVEISIMSDDHFIILGSDGLWDHLSEEAAVSIVYDHICKGGDWSDCGKALCKKAAASGSLDNISALVVLLRDLDFIRMDMIAATGSVPSSMLWGGGGSVHPGASSPDDRHHHDDDPDLGPETVVDDDDMLPIPRISTEPDVHDVAGASESDEEWSYTRGSDDKEKSTRETADLGVVAPSVELSSPASNLVTDDKQEEEEDMESGLNPDAAEFVPVLSSVPDDLLQDENNPDSDIISSPAKSKKTSLEDIELPKDQIAFNEEVASKPCDLDGSKYLDTSIPNETTDIAVPSAPKDEEEDTNPFLVNNDVDDVLSSPTTSHPLVLSSGIDFVTSITESDEQSLAFRQFDQPAIIQNQPMPSMSAEISSHFNFIDSHLKDEEEEEIKGHTEMDLSSELNFDNLIKSKSNFTKNIPEGDEDEESRQIQPEEEPADFSGNRNATDNMLNGFEDQMLAHGVETSSEIVSDFTEPEIKIEEDAKESEVMDKSDDDMFATEVRIHNDDIMTTSFHQAFSNDDNRFGTIQENPAAEDLEAEEHIGSLSEKELLVGDEKHFMDKDEEIITPMQDLGIAGSDHDSSFEMINKEEVPVSSSNNPFYSNKMEEFSEEVCLNEALRGSQVSFETATAPVDIQFNEEIMIETNKDSQAVDTQKEQLIFETEETVNNSFGVATTQPNFEEESKNLFEESKESTLVEVTVDHFDEIQHHEEKVLQMDHFPVEEPVVKENVETVENLMGEEPFNTQEDHFSFKAPQDVNGHHHFEQPSEISEHFDAEVIKMEPAELTPIVDATFERPADIIISKEETEVVEPEIVKHDELLNEPLENNAVQAVFREETVVPTLEVIPAEEVIDVKGPVEDVKSDEPVCNGTGEPKVESIDLLSKATAVTAATAAVGAVAAVSAAGIKSAASPKGKVDAKTTPARSPAAKTQPAKAPVKAASTNAKKPAPSVPSKTAATALKAAAPAKPKVPSTMAAKPASTIGSVGTARPAAKPLSAAAKPLAAKSTTAAAPAAKTAVSKTATARPPISKAPAAKPAPITKTTTASRPTSTSTLKSSTAAPKPLAAKPATTAAKPLNSKPVLPAKTISKPATEVKRTISNSTTSAAKTTLSSKTAPAAKTLTNNRTVSSTTGNKPTAAKPLAKGKPAPASNAKKAAGDSKDVVKPVKKISLEIVNAVTDNHHSEPVTSTSNGCTETIETANVA